MGSQPLVDQIEWLVLFAIVVLIFFIVGWRKGFFRLPKVERENCVSSFQLLSVFGLYLGITFLVSPLLIRILRIFLPISQELLISSPYLVMGWVQLFTLTLVVAALFFYCRAQNKNTIQKIWKDRNFPGARSIAYDFGIGMLTWCISFPTVAIINQLSDLFLHYVFGVESYEQVAVRYLTEMLSESNATIIIGLVSVVLAAPVIEELLFRGFLQNYFKRYVGAKAAIMLTAIAFALFHLSPSQGLGNISLVLSLFSFACFLGFVYEKQRSLFASIGLHMTFNTISTIRIMFTPET